VLGDEWTPCAVEGDFVRPCVTLDGMIDGRALRLLVIHDLSSVPFKPKRSMVVMHMGAHKKNGLVVNNCPFCGARISAHLERQQEPNRATPPPDPPPT